MLYFYELLGLVTLVVTVYSLIDIITTDEAGCRNLPKLFWLLLVLFFNLLGSIAWLVAGRPQRGHTVRRSGPYERSQPQFPEYDRPGRFAASDPQADEAFLRQCRERAEEQRRKAAGES